MSIRLDKEWVRVSEALQRLKGNMGVFQLGDSSREIIFIGFAGAKSNFGLTGEISESLDRLDGAEFVRWEVTTAYWSRYKELMMIHQFDHGDCPKENEKINLGRLSPE